MKNYIQPGDVVTVAAPYDVTSGSGVLVGTLFGIAAFSAVSGASVEIQIVGVFDVAKVSAQAWTQGAAVYWDDTAKNFTTTSASNTLVAKATEAAANPSAVGRVRLNG
jgi:predicted RecA/RadA family phage recombinase